MKTSVVNLRHEAYDVYIGRAGRGLDGYFGNPYRLVANTSAGRARCLDEFKGYFYNRVEEDPEFKARVLALRGQRLGCFCKPKDCHGDVMCAWIESQPEGR